jgi:hypothetical protein
MGQGIDFQMLAIENPVTELRGKNRLGDVNIDRGLPRIAKGDAFIVAQLDPEKIDGH